MRFELNGKPKQTTSAHDSVFLSGDNQSHPSPSVCSFNFVWFSCRQVNCHLPQLPDTVVTDRRRLDSAPDTDAESPTTPRITTSNDPYNFGHALKTDAEITELRNRKRGKRLASYHRKQNDVCDSSFLHVVPQRCSRTAYHFSIKTHGGAYRGCQE